MRAGKMLMLTGIITMLMPCTLKAEEKIDIGSADLSQLQQTKSLNNFKPAADEFRIYFIGDSITEHGFNQDTIKEFKWDHAAGMAASSESKDYAHLLADQVRKMVPDKKVRLFFGAGCDAVKALTRIADAKKYQPALVIVQLGEHVVFQEPREKVAADYAALLDALKALPSKPLILCTGVWNPQPGLKKYNGRAALIEEVQREVCQQKNIPFASVEKYALDPLCSGTGESGGVRWHPNDAGQAGYAKELFALFKENYRQ